MLLTATASADINSFGVLRHSTDWNHLESFARYKLILLENLPEDPSKIEALRALNHRQKILLSFNPYFYWDNPLTTRPNSVLRDKSGQAIHYRGPTYASQELTQPPAIMDIRNKAWQQEFVEAAAYLSQQLKLDGVLLDTWTNVYPPWAKDEMGVPPFNYSEREWKLSMLQFTGLVSSAFPKEQILIFNGLTRPLPEKDLGPDSVFLDAFDGATYEAFGIYKKFHEGKAWRKHYFEHSIMTAMKQATSKDKYFLLEVQGDESNEPARLFALASFLLLQNKKSFFYYDDQTQTPSANWFKEWETKLGKPLTMFTVQEGVYLRHFKNALVLVNPTSTGKVIKPGTGLPQLKNQIRLSPFEGRIISEHN